MFPKGRVRRGFESARADAQALLAAFHNVLLTLHGDVAQNYFALRTLDAEISTVTSTVGLRKEQVQLVRSRFEGGIGNELDVARMHGKDTQRSGDRAVTEDVRQYATEQGVSEQELCKGMEEKSREFRGEGQRALRKA